MSLRILFGPVTAHFADQNLFDSRHDGRCLAFGNEPDLDLRFESAESWPEIRAKLPDGWQPDAVALWLPYTQIPAGIWAAPVPIIGLAADWNLLFHTYRTFLNRCDSVLTDGPGVEALTKAGFDHVRQANLFGLERAFLENAPSKDQRDIEVLFVGNFHAAVQRERLPWLGRLAQLADRWNVRIATGVFGDDYRALLGRSRVAFNRSIRGECNKRTFEAPACGAMLFQESENLEVREYFTEETEFVAYTQDNLEVQLDELLRDEDRRRAIADAARARVKGYSFEALWSRSLERLQDEWPEIQKRAQRRVEQHGAPTSTASAAATASSSLHEDLLRIDDLLRAGQTAAAVSQVRQVLASLDRSSGLPTTARDLQLWSRSFNLDRVEWERAAWANADDFPRELQAKNKLLHWQLHLRLAELTGDLAHYYEAVLARPDLAGSRAALGCALGRSGRFVEARSHLEFAVAAQPFDLPAVTALADVLHQLRDGEACERLSKSRRSLSKAAPGIVPTEEWFASPLQANDLASVIILCCNEVEATRRCLESVRRHTRQPYELILIDNGSTDATPQSLAATESWPEPLRVLTIRNEQNRGYPAGVNQGLAAARGQFLVLLNNDTVVTPGWLEGIIRVSLLSGGPAMVGPVSNYAPEPQLVPAGYTDLSGLDDFALAHRERCAGQIQEFPRLTGFCMLLPRPALKKIGGLDEQYGAGFFDDDDLCVRARRAGVPLRVALDVYLHHEGSRTFRALGLDTSNLLRQNFERFKQKWGAAEAAPYRANDSIPGSPDSPDPIYASASNGSGTTARPRFSLVMMVKNEEKNIADCAACVRDLVNEMIVIDTGSTDRTKEIATGMGAKVFDFPWVDSFSAARNEGLRHASGEWVFWLDADDRLDEANREKLRVLFGKLGLEQAAYVMDCRCFEAPPRPDTVVNHVRLFRRDPRLRWTHRVHEQILPALRAIGTQVQFCDVEIHHVGYRDPALRKAKGQRDLRLLEIELKELPDHPFTLFNLGQAYRDIGRPEEALPFLQRSIALSDPGDSIVRKLYAMVAACHRQLGKPAEALQACLEGRKLYPDDEELLFTEALARREMEDLTGAESCLRRLIDGRETGDHLSSVADGLRGYLGRHYLADLLMVQNRDTEAEALWRTALTEAPNYTTAWLGLGRLYARNKQYAAAEQVAERLGESADAAEIRGRVRLARKEFGAAQRLLSQAIERFPRELMPRVIFSHALLQEGKDWEAAERALRDILTLDPQNAEANNNLQVLLEQRKREGPTGRLSI
jgi:GT2 family glycosyltransferase/Flp pilus assembly protein TadD